MAPRNWAYTLGQVLPNRDAGDMAPGVGGIDLASRRQPYHRHKFDLPIDTALGQRDRTEWAGDATGEFGENRR